MECIDTSGDSFFAVTSWKWWKSTTRVWLVMLNSKTFKFQLVSWFQLHAWQVERFWRIHDPKCLQEKKHDKGEKSLRIPPCNSSSKIITKNAKNNPKIDRSAEQGREEMTVMSENGTGKFVTAIILSVFWTTFVALGATRRNGRSEILALDAFSVRLYCEYFWDQISSRIYRSHKFGDVADQLPRGRQ